MLTLTNDMIKLYETKVLYLASKYANTYNKEDLVQAGQMGIVKAAKKYDENLGIKFSTFCEKYILGEILEYIRKDKNIKVSRDFIRLKRKIDIASNKYYENNNKFPSIDELSYILNESKEKIIEVLNTDQNVRSIEENINDNEDILLKDVISKKEHINTIDLITLRDALKELKEDDRYIIQERYYNGKSQTQLAKDMNISQVKVYRKERKILDELNYKMTC